MSFKPAEWTVVVIGLWNRGILTPSGIVKHLLELPDGAAVELMLPAEGIGPFILKRDDLIISVPPNSLRIALENRSYETLDFARQIAIRAVQYLPATPFSAVGFNVRFNSTDPEPELLEQLSAPLDRVLTGAVEITGKRKTNRSILELEGRLNLDIDSAEDDSLTVNFNFHLDSNKSTEIVEWLGRPIDEIKNRVESILSMLKMEVEDENHDE